MAQIVTLPTPDQDVLDLAQKEQKNATKSGPRRGFFKKCDNLLQRIPPLPEYHPMAIEHRAAVIHLPENTFLTLRTLFGLIWTTTYCLGITSG